MQELIEDIGKWSSDTFGENDRTVPLFEHTKKEVDEAIIAYNNKSPYFDWAIADCLILLFDIMYRNNISMDQMQATIQKKMQVNKKRQWSLPDEDGVIEHA
jgi:hypothetical protein